MSKTYPNVAEIKASIARAKKRIGMESINQGKFYKDYLKTAGMDVRKLHCPYGWCSHKI